MKRGIVPADSNFDKHNQDQVDRLIEYRKATRGITPRGEEWLRDMLRFFLRQLHKPVEDVIPQDITRFLGRYMDKPYQRHCLYRALKSFYNWLKRGRSVSFNPMDEIDPPKLPKKLMNAVTAEQVPVLIKEARCTRDRAIISLLADSGVRRFELCNISVVDVDMDNSRIRVRGKGEKEGYLIFGPATGILLAQHIGETNPTDKLFDLSYDGLRTMLNRLGARLGIKLNAHDFRRGFATTLRKSGVGELDIQQLGRWESLEMVRRYTRSYTFDDAAQRYKPIVT